MDFSCAHGGRHETMEAVLVLKSETKNRHYTDEELDRIKSAYSEAQQQHKKKKN
jgi:hypothetical protein